MKIRFTGLTAVFLLASGAAWAGSIPIETAYAPDSDLALAVQAIKSAQRRLVVNIYELTSPEIADALIDRIRAGIQVEILEEGQPVGGLSTAAKGIQSELAQAMAGRQNGDHLLEMYAARKSQRRYAFDHAKYTIIDDQSVLIGSENYSPTGNPTPGSVGNRGWEVWVQDPALAQQLEGVFATDANPSAGDVVDVTAAAQTDTLSVSRPVLSIGTPGPVLSADSVALFASPDTSKSGLLGLIQQARSSIDVELMTLAPSWGRSSDRNPLLDALVAAARRGVAVRVLLNDESVFSRAGTGSHPQNPVSAEWLNQQAVLGHLRLQALIANVRAMGVDYIHNKGALVDGNFTLISSINWDENSIERNRETALVIGGQQVFQYYENIFNHDWQVSSASAPLQMPARPFSPNDAALFSPEGEGPAVACPSALTVQTRVGQLEITNPHDLDYRSLSGAVMQDHFVRDRAGSGCVLSNVAPSQNLRQRRFLEIRRNSSGHELLVLEGYTPNSGKLYSIRGLLPDGDGTRLGLSAAVYEGSGLRDLLGYAELEIRTTE